eukprot:gene12250-13395_t
MNRRPKFLLSKCCFTEKDDLAYLTDDITWIESRAPRLETHEKQYLSELIILLHGMDPSSFNKKFFHHVWKNCFNKSGREDCKRQNLVRNIFLAAIIREVILRTETSESMTKNRESFLEEFDFLQNEEGTDEELTWLNRYARALKILSEIYNEGKKTLMMGVAAHLQGSSVFTEYTTGGANKPETSRRVRLHEMITGYAPKKRPPRDGKKESPSQATVKRGRGRPRKSPMSSQINSECDKNAKLISEDLFEEFSDLSGEDLLLISPFCSSDLSSEDDYFKDDKAFAIPVNDEEEYFRVESCDAMEQIDDAEFDFIICSLFNDPEK